MKEKKQYPIIKELVKIEEVELENGECTYNFNVGEVGESYKGNMSCGPIRDPFSCIIEILNELGYLSNEDVEAYLRITCEEHMEVIDENIILKLKEALKLADIIRDLYYKK